jgi:16S rRNA (guanine(966)-N(2))-methyltransferase RsmD
MGLRPTSDRLRETLFNVLGNHVKGARFVDGFAGTGAIGLEALSRGAAHVTFIERDRRATALIRRNLIQCGINARYTMTHGGFVSALGKLETGECFDVVVLDPPYGCIDPLVLELGATRLAAGGLLVLEHDSSREPPQVTGLAQERVLRSGNSALTFMRRS